LITAQYYLSGYNNGDYNIILNNTSSAGKHDKWQIISAIQSSLREPELFFVQRLSNHYFWQNQFSKSAYQTISINAIKKANRPSVYNAFSYALPARSIDVTASYTAIDKYIYNNRNGMPVQLNSMQSIIQIAGRFHFNLKKFQINQQLVYQELNDGLKNAIQLPEILSKTSLYYQNYAFKKATFIQIGIDAFYTTSYFAGDYNPALLTFTTGDKSVGAYPTLDFFINAEVKTARIFFKMEHFNQDLIAANNFQNYMFASPYHPIAPRRFRLGFTWKFYY
jgi:hypothetical protein